MHRNKIVTSPDWRHLSYFKEMPEGPLSDGLEIRAEEGWTPEQLSEWLEGELDDPEIVVVVTIDWDDGLDDDDEFTVTACVGRVEQLARTG
ncbi:hypothetical protein [Kozakia baliensis]|nr:hypothetical protein [Kozakia baliensis]